MGKINYVNNGVYEAYKKAHVVEDGKYVKLKKAFIVEDGKYVKLWSSDLGFLYSTSTSAYVSSDGTSYVKVQNHENFDSVIFAMGKFWASYCSYQTMKIYSSTDGINWTLVSTITGTDCYFFNTSILRYQNGVFIAMTSYDSVSKTMVYSTDGITWTAVKITTNSLTYSAAPSDIRYGTVGGVSGWYIVTGNSGTNTNSIHLYRFNSLSDIQSGNLTFLISRNAAVSSAAISIRNDKAYIFHSFCYSDRSASNNSINLISYDGSKITSIATETQTFMGTVWSTDKYFICKGCWLSSNAGFSLLQPIYEFETGIYSNGKSNNSRFFQSYNPVPFTGVFVGSRMYQVVPWNNYDYTSPITRGAYSDDYGATVTTFDISNDTGSGNRTYLVYGDDGGGFYQEQY